MKWLAILLALFQSSKALQAQLLRGGFWSLVIKLISTLMALLTAVVLARVLGPEGFGVYSFVFALVSMLTIPAQMGLPNLLVRETAKAHTAERWDVMKGLWRWSSLRTLGMSAMLMILGGLASMLFATQLGEAQTTTLWWGLLLVPLISLGNMRGAALRGLKKVIQGQLPEFVVRPGVFIIFVVAAWLLCGNVLLPSTAMGLHVAAAFLSFMLGAALLFMNSPMELIRERAYIESRTEWFKSAVPLAIVGGTDYITQNAAIIMVGISSESADVADFRIAMQISLVMSFGVSTTKNLISPYIAGSFAAEDHESTASILKYNSYMSLTLCAIPLVIFILAGRFLTNLAFGHEYNDAYDLALILGAGQLAYAIWPSGNVLLHMTGNEKKVMKVSAVTMVCTIPLLFLASELGGSYGVATVSSASFACWSIWLARIAKRETGLDVSVFAPFNRRLRQHG